MSRPHRPTWRFVLADSLEKVFADREPRPFDRAVPLTAFDDQTVSFQIAMLPPSASGYEQIGAVLVEAEAPPGVAVGLASVELVPCGLVAFDDHDDGWLVDGPGLYPDLLRPVADGGAVVPVLGGWRAVWVTVTPHGVDGAQPVTVRLRSDETGELLHSETVEVRCSPVRLPALDIVHTQWVHPDGLADRYGDEVFDEGHWTAIDRTLAKAAAMRVNSVLTPVWTPPLDTAVGATRRRVQLVDVAVDERGAYTFGFERLRRWMDLCRRHGIDGLEVAHLFTQWGAAAAPQVWVRTPQGDEQRFGWHTAATDPEYGRFLAAIVPALRTLFDREWAGRVVWHISDEPHGPAMLASYRAARAVVADLLDGCLVVDALSDFAFWETGEVPCPVVATDAVDPFLRAGVDRLWMYYCVAQTQGVSNRFIGMPSARTRAIGGQLFAHRAGGFLHWGFDFYLTRNSVAPVDPFADTCAGGAFLAGDAFVVYPGADREPWESIRFRVLAEAMDDHRTLQALRDRFGEEAARAAVDPDGTLTMTTGSLEPASYRRFAASAFALLASAAPPPADDAPPTRT